MVKKRKSQRQIIFMLNSLLIATFGQFVAAELLFRWPIYETRDLGYTLIALVFLFNAAFTALMTAGAYLNLKDPS